MVLRAALLVFSLARAAGAAAAAPAAAAGAAQPGAAAGYMVCELDLQSGGKEVTNEMLAKVFEELGAPKEKFQPVLDKRASGADEKVLVTAGDQATCEKVKEKFAAIGMKVEVRALSQSDVPSMYDNSDVVPADQIKLAELIDGAGEGQGVLVVFSAPWCKHCHTLVPEMKSAATKLKKEGISVAAVNTQASPRLAQSLGVKMLPTILWLQKMGENTAAAEYQGARDSASIIRFAQMASAAINEQVQAGKIPGGEAQKAAASTEATAVADEKAAAGSKIGQSKLGKSKAAAPPEAEGESKIAESKAKESEVKEGAKAEGVKKAETPA